MIQTSEDSDTSGNDSNSSNAAQPQVAKGFIPAWVLLIICGVAIEFGGRFFGYENNPLQSYHPWMAQLAVTLSGIIIIAGYFTFLSGGRKRSTLHRRNGVLLMAMGGIMLATSFILKMLMPLIFG